MDRHATETRIAHFFENRACVTTGGPCIGSEWFNFGFVNWALGLGLDQPIDALVEYVGYPKSIGDASLNPDTEGLVAADHNAIVALFSHIEPIDVGILSTIPAGPSAPGVPAPPDFNFAWTSYFGDMMRSPTAVAVPEATGWPGAPARDTSADARGPMPMELIDDSSFSLSLETVDAADAVLAEPESSAYFDADIIDIGEAISDTCAFGWPSEGVWQATRPDVQRGGTLADAYAEFGRPTQLAQNLDQATTALTRIDLFVEFELLSADGSVSVSLQGPGMEGCEMWDGTTHAVGQRFIERVSGLRLPGYVDQFGIYGGDSLVVYGRDARVYQVTSIEPAPPECPGDANGDNVVDFADLDLILDRWNTAVVPDTNGDLNGDGFVNFQDLDELLDRWNTSCA